MSLEANETTSSLGNPNAPKTNPSNNQGIEREDIDDSLNRLLSLLPEQPYILTVPSYDLNIDSWKLQNEQQLLRQNYPFRTAELHHQYMSFLWRDPTDSCFEIRTELDEERERRAKELKQSGMSRVAAASPLPSGVTKKKISLAAYKNKLAGGDRSQIQSPMVTPSEKGDKKDLEHQKVVQSEIESFQTDLSSTPDTRKKTDSFNRSEKRKSPEFTQDTPNKKAKTQGHNNIKLPPIASPLSSQGLALPPLQSPLHGDAMDLPPMLSPIPSDLPPMLSPTLPADLEEELLKLEKQRKRALSSASNSSDKKEIPQSKINLKVSASKDANRSGLATQKSIHIESSTSKQSHIVTIKLSKRLRREVEQIWRSSNKLASAISLFNSPSTKDRKTTESSHRATNGMSQSSQDSGKKRPLDAVIDQPVKKHRKMLSTSLSLDDNVPTPSYDPATPQETSPLMNKSRAPITPKENGSSSMVRSISNNSKLSTPRQITTPLPPHKSADKLRKTSPVNPAKQQDAAQLSAWSKKFNDMGRKLKHEAQAISTSSRESSQSGSTVNDKLKAIRNTECIMSYMLAYSFTDARLRLVGRTMVYEETWNTLFPMLDVARNSARVAPVLEGLTCYLGYAVDKRVRDGIASELEHKSGASDEELRTLLKKLARTQEKSRSRYMAAKALLSLKTIRSKYPETYKATEDVDLAELDEVEDMLVTKGLTGPFTLPVSEFIVPSQAVRFAVSFLKEWIGKQDGLDCELKVSKIPEENLDRNV